MVEIQQAHPNFVPLLEWNPATWNFNFNLDVDFINGFVRQATTVAGLKAGLKWDPKDENEQAKLLGDPKCSICTLDFSRIPFESCCKSEFVKEAFAKKTLRSQPGSRLSRTGRAWNSSDLMCANWT